MNSIALFSDQYIPSLLNRMNPTWPPEFGISRKKFGLLVASYGKHDSPRKGSFLALTNNVGIVTA